MNEFMRIAAEEAREGIYAGHGGPFGCVIVKDGKIVGEGHNMVLANIDSTAHGEITAIRSIDLTSPYYQDVSHIEKKIKDDINSLSLFAISRKDIGILHMGLTILWIGIEAFEIERFGLITVSVFIINAGE